MLIPTLPHLPTGLWNYHRITYKSGDKLSSWALTDFFKKTYLLTKIHIFLGNVILARSHLAGMVFSGSKNLISHSLSLNHQDFSAVWHFYGGLVLFPLSLYFYLSLLSHLSGRSLSNSKNLISHSLSLNHQDFSAVLHFL